ncbi:hypothetical protein [Nocardiopsis synnemataformans]|uniref:hypothetical protein n=1 Tax=Nocardiopsis synnemataformans TaxID=61305 RepID=UPI003EBCB2B7
MAYADKYTSKKDGTYFRVRYLLADGINYGSCAWDDDGTRFRTRTAAETWGKNKEALIRMGLDAESAPSVVEAARRLRQKDGALTLGEYAGRWYPEQELAISTQESYRTYLELHILPYCPPEQARTWADTPLTEITSEDITTWLKNLAARGYAETSIASFRAILHLMLQDAVDAELLKANPAARRHGRGRRAGKAKKSYGRRASEKVTVPPLEALLHAERMALLTGRGEEFVFGIALAYTGIRFAELVGLEREYLRGDTLRVEHQLHEVRAEFHRVPPKDDSYRDVDLPPFLADLLAHQAKTTKQPVRERCLCLKHKRVDRYLVAALKRREQWDEDMEKALLSAAELADVVDDDELIERFADTFTRRPRALPHQGGVFVFRGQQSPHHFRGSMRSEIFAPAATGITPVRHKGTSPKPVPLEAGGWPGRPIRGHNGYKVAQAHWLPIAPGYTPHGNRHSHKTWMQEDRIPEVLQYDRLGHEMPGIGGVYSHVTAMMRQELLGALTVRWENSMRLRADLHPHSPVALLDHLLEPYRTAYPYTTAVPLTEMITNATKVIHLPRRSEPTKALSQISPNNVVLPLRSRGASQRKAT